TPVANPIITAVGVLPITTPEVDKSLDDNTKWLAGLLRDNMVAPAAGGADVLVLDVTQNTGGYIKFDQGLLSLFADKPYGGFLQALHPDRAWVQSFLMAAGK